MANDTAYCWECAVFGIVSPGLYDDPIDPERKLCTHHRYAYDEGYLNIEPIHGKSDRNVCSKCGNTQYQNFLCYNTLGEAICICAICMSTKVSHVLTNSKNDCRELIDIDEEAIIDSSSTIRI